MTAAGCADRSRPFLAQVGVLTRNGGNQFTGVHVWNLGSAEGGAGFMITERARLVNCYIDSTTAVV